MCLAEFSKNLKLMLSEKGMSQSDLARAIETTPTAITYWVNGVKEPTLSNIYKITKALDCTFEELIEK